MTNSDSATHISVKTHTQKDHLITVVRPIPEKHYAQEKQVLSQLRIIQKLGGKQGPCFVVVKLVKVNKTGMVCKV